jgi:dihydrolipoamide dehydrogenase
MKKSYDVIVIGGGPGGYVAAIRASQLGLSTVIVELDKLGGVCLNWGCIPSKALLKNAEIFNLLKRSGDFGYSFKDLKFDLDKIVSRSRAAAETMSKGVEYLIKHNNIHHISGQGILEDNESVQIIKNGIKTDRINGKHIIIATGGKPRSLPGVPIDGKAVISSKEALVPDSIPGSLTIIGGGAIGVEFAYFYASFGSRVTVVEILPQLLPHEDAEISKSLARSFKKQGIKVLAGTKVEKAKKMPGGMEVTLSKNGKTSNIKSDQLLIAIGIEPNTESIGLDKIGIERENGFICVDANFQSSVTGIFAVGDCIGGQLLAHTASAEGIACAEYIAEYSDTPLDYNSIPRCTYCQPQVASIGLTEEQAVRSGYNVKVGKYYLKANGKAVAGGESEGMVKLVFDEKYGELLGAHIIGANASEMIAEIGIAKTMEATYEDIVNTVHAHPTLAESVMEAAGQAYGKAIHV